MINDSFVRLGELERAYAALQASHARLLADYRALGGKVRKGHTQGSIDPDLDDENFPKVVLGNPKFLTQEELSKEVYAGMLEALKPIIDAANANKETLDNRDKA